MSQRGAGYSSGHSSASGHVVLCMWSRREWGLVQRFTCNTVRPSCLRMNKGRWEEEEGQRGGTSLCHLSSLVVFLAAFTLLLAPPHFVWTNRNHCPRLLEALHVYTDSDSRTTVNIRLSYMGHSVEGSRQIAHFNRGKEMFKFAALEKVK